MITVICEIKGGCLVKASAFHDSFLEDDTQVVVWDWDLYGSDPPDHTNLLVTAEITDLDPRIAQAFMSGPLADLDLEGDLETCAGPERWAEWQMQIFGITPASESDV